VPADYVGRAIVDIHQRAHAEHGIYHLSSGQDSLRYDQIVRSLELHGRRMRHVFVPGANRSFERLVSAAASAPQTLGVARPAALLKVFLPYLCFDTVFDNTRVVQALGESPAAFDTYASRLLDFAVDHAMTYPYKPWPENTAQASESAYA
jgi:hypothetical protein